MGLDMTLYERVFIGGQYEHRNVTGNFEIFIAGEKVDIELKEVEEIIVERIYWRKANMIHNWFVENIQNGYDGCQESPVSEKQLQELLDICMEVKFNPVLAEELLPTKAGFFFGSNDYDEWYKDDINFTVDELKKLLKKSKGGNFYYRASW